MQLMIRPLPGAFSLRVQYIIHMTFEFPSVVEAYETQRLAKAQRDGFALFPVNAGDNCPGFVYSVGMCQHGLPELLCFFTEDMAAATCNMLSQVCSHMIEGSKHFDIGPLLKVFISHGITVKDPTIHYSPEYLKGDTYVYALQAYATRAARFKDTLGFPKGILVMNHEGVPSIQQIRAHEMLAKS